MYIIFTEYDLERYQHEGGHFLVKPIGYPRNTTTKESNNTLPAGMADAWSMVKASGNHPQPKNGKKG